MMTYQVKLDTFEGPLDLLLHLIDKEEMDIYDIEISKITEQYLQYLHTMQILKLDIVSEFLVMASTLLSIKSRMLLPNHSEALNDPFLDMDEEAIDPREELVQRLIEYKKYKELSAVLKEKEVGRHQLYTRAPGDLSNYSIEQEQNPLEGISLYHLLDVFEKALVRASYRDPLTKVEREEISIQDKIEQILYYLKAHHGRAYFSNLILLKNTKSDIVVTFLGILELMKQNQVYCLQSHAFDDIVIHYSPEGVIKYGLQ